MAAPDPRALIGKWLGMAGPSVTVALEFAADGAVQLTTEPASQSSAARYATSDGGRLAITFADGSKKAYHFRIDAQLFTLDQEGGPRFIFRRTS